VCGRVFFANPQKSTAAFFSVNIKIPILGRFAQFEFNFFIRGMQMPLQPSNVSFLAGLSAKKHGIVVDQSLPNSTVMNARLFCKICCIPQFFT